MASLIFQGQPAKNIGTNGIAKNSYPAGGDVA